MPVGFGPCFLGASFPSHDSGRQLKPASYGSHRELQRDLFSSTGKRVVSKDAKTMTISTTGTNAQGQKTSSMQLFEKQ